MKRKKTATVSKECVACGNCVNYCPKRAISIDRGVCAVVDEIACIGCGLCERACPAGVIALAEKEGFHA